MERDTQKIERGISKLPNGKFEVRVSKRIKGKLSNKRKRNLSSLSDARYYRNTFEKELDALKQKMLDGVVTWQEARAEYYAYARDKLRASTFLNQKNSLEAHTKCWDDAYIDAIHKHEVESQIVATLAGKTADTKNGLAKFIRNVFKLQVDKGTIDRNPGTGVTFKTDGLKRKKLICMTRGEIEKLFHDAFRQNHIWADIWYVVYNLGLRSGEAYALTWDDVDFENKVVHITKSYCSASRTFGPPKSKEVRVVPLNPALAKHLKKMRLKNVNGNFVLPHPPGWRHGDAAAILASFQKDIGIRQTNFHSLRASFITHLLLANKPMTLVQQMVGHADLETTMFYVRQAGSDLVGGTDAINLEIDVKDAEVIQLNRDKN